MANLQVKDLPADMHRELKRLAKKQGRTLRDLTLDALRREIAQARFDERLARRAPVDLGRRAAEALDEVRRERELEIGH